MFIENNAVYVYTLFYRRFGIASEMSMSVGILRRKTTNEQNCKTVKCERRKAWHVLLG